MVRSEKSGSFSSLLASPPSQTRCKRSSATIEDKANSSPDRLAPPTEGKNDHSLIEHKGDSLHPAALIPELCRSFYKLGWVTGTGGGISLRDGSVPFCSLDLSSPLAHCSSSLSFHTVRRSTLLLQAYKRNVSSQRISSS